MRFEESLRLREHRILKKMRCYKPIQHTADFSFESQHRLNDYENIMGIYENSKEKIRSNIVITTMGLHFFDVGWVFVP